METQPTGFHVPLTNVLVTMRDMVCPVLYSLDCEQTDPPRYCSDLGEVEQSGCARRPHKPEVAGSNPAHATYHDKQREPGLTAVAADRALVVVDCGR